MIREANSEPLEKPVLDHNISLDGNRLVDVGDPIAPQHATTRAWVEANAGGGLIHQAMVTLADAQIKLLPTTPIVVIPATEVLNYSGFPTALPVVVKAIFILDAAAGAYTNVNSVSQLILALGSDWSLALGRSLRVNSTTPYWGLGGIGFNQAKKYFVPLVIGDETVSSNAIQDNAVAITMDNQGTGNLTGGNAANTLTVVVAYTKLNLLTGLFE